MLNINMKNNNYLLDICKRHGITLTELGNRIGETKQYMSELGRGNIRLTYEMAVKVAMVFNTTPDALFLSSMSKEILLQPTGTDHK